MSLVLYVMFVLYLVFNFHIKLLGLCSNGVEIVCLLFCGEFGSRKTIELLRRWANQAMSY